MMVTFNVIILITLIVAIPPTIAALYAIWSGAENKKQIKVIHMIMNSRLDELITLIKAESYAEGFGVAEKEGADKVIDVAKDIARAEDAAKIAIAKAEDTAAAAAAFAKEDSCATQKKLNELLELFMKKN